MWYHMKRKRRKFLRNNGRYKKKTSFAKARPRVNGKFISMYAKCVPNKCWKELKKRKIRISGKKEKRM